MNIGLDAIGPETEFTIEKKTYEVVSAKWSQSGHQEVVNLGFLLVSQILRKLQQKPDLKLSKPLNINRRPPPTP